MNSVGAKYSIFRTLRALALFCLVMLFACNDMAVTNTVAPIPTNVQATTDYDDRIEVTWDCVGNPKSFAIFRAESKDTEGKDYMRVASVSGRSYTDPVDGLIPGKLYYYRIASYDRSQSKKSELFGVGNVKVPTLENISASTDEKGRIVVSWTMPVSIMSSAIDGYITVYYSENPVTIFNEKSKKIFIADMEDSHDLTDVVSGQEYYIRIVASVKAVGADDILYKHSDASASIMGKAAVASPPGVEASKGLYEDGILITWDRAEGMEGFRIHRDIVDDGVISYPNFVKDLYVGSDGFKNRRYFDKDADLEMGTGYRYVVIGLVSDGLGDLDELDLSGDRDKQDSLGVFKNLGYKNYNPVENVSVTTDEIDTVILKYTTTVGTFGNVYAQLYRRDFAPDGEFVALGEPESVSSTNFTLIDTSVVPGKKYYYSAKIYRLSGQTKVGASDYAQKVEGYSALEFPQNVVADTGISQSKLNIRWNKVKGAKRYVVYIGNDSLDMKEAGRCQDTLYWITSAKYFTGLVYYFRVKAFNDIASENSAAVDGWMRIQTPMNFAVVQKPRGEDWLEFVWDAVPKAKEFVLERRHNLPDSVYVAVDTIVGSATSYFDRGLTTGSEYAYKLHAVSNQLLALPDTYQVSEKTPELLARTLLSPPVLDSVSQDEDGFIYLSWIPQADVPDVEYRIYKELEDGGATDVAATADTSIKIYSSEVLLPGELYTFAVSVRDAEESEKSNLMQGFSKLDSAYNLEATDGTLSDTIRLTWQTDKLTGVQNFFVLRKGKGDATFANVGDLAVEKGVVVGDHREYTYNDKKDLSDKIKYIYKVESHRASYEEQDVKQRYSNIDSGMVKIFPPAFDRAGCGKEDGEITIYFEKDTTAHLYLCDYSTSPDFKGSDPIQILPEETVEDSLRNKLMFTMKIENLGLKAGQLCYFRLASNKAGQVSSFSEILPGFSKLAQPTFASVSGGEFLVAPIHLMLRAIDNPDEVEYEIKRTRDKGSITTSEIVTSTFYDDHDVVDGYRYLYEYRIINKTALSVCNEYYLKFNDEDAKSDYSQSIAGYVKVKKVTGLTASIDIKDSVLVRWNMLPGDIVRYEVIRRRMDQTVWESVLKNFSDSSWTDEHKYSNEQGYLYYYRVKSYTTDFPDLVEISDSVRGFMKPLSPANVKAGKGEYEDTIKVSWGYMPLVQSYTVLRLSDLGDVIFHPEVFVDGDRTYFYDNTDLIKGQEYFYLVKAKLSEQMGETDYSDTLLYSQKLAATGFTKLPKVSNMQATMGDYLDSVVVTWDDIDAAHSYSIVRYLDSVSKYELTTESNKYVDYREKSMRDGELYGYTVIGRRDNLVSVEVSDTAFGYLMPESPRNVQASENLRDSIIVSWDLLNTTPVNSYLIYRGDFPDNHIGEVSALQGRYAYAVPKLDKGLNISFYVKAVTTNFGISGKSKDAVGYCQMDTLTGFSAIEIDAGTDDPKVQLSWQSAGSSDSTRLLLQVGASWQTIAVLHRGETKYIDTARPVGQELVYRGQAFRRDDDVDKNSLFVTTSITMLIPTIAFDSISKSDVSNVALHWSGLPTRDEQVFQVFVYKNQDDYDNDDVWDTLTLTNSDKESYGLLHSTSATPDKFVCGRRYFYRLRTRTAFDGVWSELTPKDPRPNYYYGWAKTPKPIIDSVTDDLLKKITVYWRYNSDANTGQIRANGPSYEGYSIVTNSGEYTNSQVYGGHIYNFAVRAINQELGDTSEWSETTSGMALLLPPEDMQASKGTKDDTVQITWSVEYSKGNYGAVQYEVQRGEDTVEYKAVKSFKDPDWKINPHYKKFTYNDVLSYSDQGKMYYYRLVSVGGLGICSDPSTIDSGWASMPAPVFTEFTGLGGELALQDNKIIVKWEDPCSLEPSKTKYWLRIEMNGTVIEQSEYGTEKAITIPAR